MMENHSYDNYLGMLQGRGDGLPLGADGEPDVVNRVPDGRQFHARHLTAVNACMNGPAREPPLLLWIYDEHGGYCDHVQPPAAVPPDDVPARNWQLSLPSWLRTALRPLLEVEPAAADPAGRGGHVAAGRAGPGRAARVRQAAGAAGAQGRGVRLTAGQPAESTNPAQRSPIMSVAALVFPDVTAGMTDASATRSPSTPCTRRSGAVTAIRSMPILQVPTWWW